MFQDTRNESFQSLNFQAQNLAQSLPHIILFQILTESAKTQGKKHEPSLSTRDMSKNLWPSLICYRSYAWSVIWVLLMSSLLISQGLEIKAIKSTSAQFSRSVMSSSLQLHEDSSESPLDCKEIQPAHSEGDQPWDFFGRNEKAETPVLWPPHAKSWLTGRDPDAGRDWGQEEKATSNS